MDFDLFSINLFNLFLSFRKEQNLQHQWTTLVDAKSIVEVYVRIKNRNAKITVSNIYYPENSVKYFYTSGEDRIE